MKILVISHMYPSQQNPTYGVFVHQQVKALVEAGCEIQVISPVPYTPWPLKLLRPKWRLYASIPASQGFEGVKVYYPRYLEFPRSYGLDRAGYFMYLGMKSLVKRITQEFSFDLIHAHVALPDGHAATYLKRDYKVPTVVTIHGQDFQSTLHRNKKCRDKLFEVLKATDRILTVSRKLKNIVQDEEFAAKVEVIHNGIDLDKVNSARTNRVSLAEKLQAGTKIRLLSVSNLKKTKGIDLNIQAFGQLVKKHPNLEYHIVGDGEERANLEELVRNLNLADQVVFHGKLPHEKALGEMAKADIFSLPSWQEGFGVVYIEAMALGLPVIGVSGEGISDVILSGENGLLVPPRQIEPLVEALESLLSSPAYADELAKAGQQTVEQEYTWQHNASQTKALYESLWR